MKLSGLALRLTPDVGLDLGSSRARVFVAGGGIVLDEPSVLAVDRQSRVAAQGDAAIEAAATDSELTVVEPIRAGVIADLALASKWIERLLKSAFGPKRLLRPTVAISVPTGATPVERRAAAQACDRAGSGKTIVVDGALAAGIGSGLALRQPQGSLVVHLGASTADVALISMGNVIASRTSRTGGKALDEAIEAHVRSALGLHTGPRGAELIKIKLGSAIQREPEMRLLVKGRDTVNGAPRAVEIGSEEIRLTLAPLVAKVSEAVWSVLEQTPADLGSDVLEEGIVMTGGAAQLHGLDAFISEVTELPVRVAENPAHCVALGLGLYLDRLSAHAARTL